MDITNTGSFDRRRTIWRSPSGVRCDQTIVLTGPKTRKRHSRPLRRIGCFDAKANRRFNFLTNRFAVPATTVAGLYRHRWRVELFFNICFIIYSYA